jgi:hypothetical protein
VLETFDTFSRLAGAIVCAFVALSIWNVGSRSPLTLARSVAAGFTRGSSILRGLLRLIVGSVFAVLALALALGVSPDEQTFSLLGIGAFVCGLAIEALLGAGVRGIFGIADEEPQAATPKR